ncbi:hypothetical protein F4810DRAFT_317493 [Camillea tinctor]|nr:hypothetical protein F4810DRAFT_317493 [Camillea tinctor]
MMKTILGLSWARAVAQRLRLAHRARNNMMLTKMPMRWSRGDIGATKDFRQGNSLYTAVPLGLSPELAAIIGNCYHVHLQEYHEISPTAESGVATTTVRTSFPPQAVQYFFASVRSIVPTHRYRPGAGSSVGSLNYKQMVMAVGQDRLRLVVA